MRRRAGSRSAPGQGRSQQRLRQATERQPSKASSAVSRSGVRASSPARGTDAPPRSTITNHPRGGPVFAGAQTQPWECVTAAQGLGAPQDPQCDVPTKVHYVYKSTSPRHVGFQDYDPANPPSDVATTKTDAGRTVPFIVRVEVGTMDRGIYNVAVLYDPKRPWAPWSPQPGWNGKVLWPFGGDCKPWHKQDTPVDATGGYGFPQATLDPPTGGTVDTGVDEALGSIFGNGNAVTALSRGFLVADSSMNKYGSTCNSVTSAEAVMMLKEAITEEYGPIRYTIGAGSSGGSMQQYQLASAYPGLLDGIQPMASFPDIWEMDQEAQDCHLLNTLLRPDLAAAVGARPAARGGARHARAGRLPDPARRPVSSGRPTSAATRRRG